RNLRLKNLPPELTRLLSAQPVGRTLVCGILNVTPDSFSDGGRFLDPRDARGQALALAQAGIDILDIGAESTRPGRAPGAAAEQWEGFKPVLDGLGQELRQACGREIVLSIDTRDAQVAQRALDRGVGLINDVSGGAFDAEMLPFVARTGAPFVL